MTRVADIDLYYERRGDGPPVLFVSGTGGDLRARPSVFEGPLPRAFDVLAHDQRGLGRSSKPPGPYTMAGYADDAVALLDVVGWERCHVVGVSFGGMVAQELALRHPSRVDRLVLACTSSGGAGGASYPLHELDGMGREERARHLIGVGDVRLDAAWQAATQERTAALVAMALERAGIGADEPDHDEGARLQLEARRGHDTWDRLGQLRCPTYVCGGRHDGIAPVANLSAMADRIPGARLELFDGGHLFLLQDSAAWPAIVSFLGEG